MNRNNKTITGARHLYPAAYEHYLRNGNLEEATRMVAHVLWQRRENRPGSPQCDWQEAEQITQAWPEAMSEASNAHLFDKALSKTRTWLKDVQEELGYDNLNQAYGALRAVLHAMRDRLPVEECAEFASQMPVLIMGMYYSGWTPSNKPERVRSMEEFLDRVGDLLPQGEDPLRVTNGVIRVLERHISGGEMSDVRRNFPARLRELWETAPVRSR